MSYDTLEQTEKRDVCPVCGKEIVWGHCMTPGYGIHGKCMPEATRIILEYNSIDGKVKHDDTETDT